MTKYEKEVYIEYLKTIPKDVPLERDRCGKYIAPLLDPVFIIDGKGK